MPCGLVGDYQHFGETISPPYLNGTTKITTWHRNPGNHNPRFYYCTNLKAHIVLIAKTAISCHLGRV
jgi:hypothetical protein